jgi:hypothetical protein
MTTTTRRSTRHADDYHSNTHTHTCLSTHTPTRTPKPWTRVFARFVPIYEGIVSNAPNDRLIQCAILHLAQSTAGSVCPVLVSFADLATVGQGTTKDNGRQSDDYSRESDWCVCPGKAECIPLSLFCHWSWRMKQSQPSIIHSLAVQTTDQCTK